MRLSIELTLSFARCDDKELLPYNLRAFNVGHRLRIKAERMKFEHIFLWGYAAIRPIWFGIVHMVVEVRVIK